MYNKNDNVIKNESGRYVVLDKKIPKDNYEVTSIIQNSDGTAIALEGKKHNITVAFGSVQCLCVCDEGARIESYNRIADIQEYRKNKFYGIPVFSVSDSGFLGWLEYESCGFSGNQNHYSVITINDFIDIAAGFPPNITITDKN